MYIETLDYSNDQVELEFQGTPVNRTRTAHQRFIAKEQNRSATGMPNFRLTTRLQKITRLVRKKSFNNRTVQTI